jgi:transposase InsO family protein
LYKFDNFGSSSFSSVFVAHSDDLRKLWHERFGHLNYHSLQQLCNQQMVTGLPLVSCRDGVCVGCVLGKHHQDSFDKRASWHTSGPLQLVHSDLCGPLSSPSFSGCKYFLTFIDDFSRRTWVYFLKLKSEVFDKFLAYKALVEKKSGHQIQKLRTDNGGEYVNNNFTSYCTTQGIQMQHIVPYTPQQNGVAERKNHTLKEMANCMIQSKGLSLKYWVEAINCENYIVNHTPTKALKNITPEEAWTKIKPDVSHFHVFGSIAWAHIPDEKRKALQPKSEKCIFVGYSEDVKGYRLLQPHCNEIIIRRDVKFDENLLACEPNSAIVPSSACEPSSVLCLLLFLFWFLLQMMTVRMKIHLHLLTFLQMSPLNLNQHQFHRFLDGSVQHEKQLVVLSVILQISVEHVHSSSEPLLFWLKFQRLMIQRHLQKLQVIQIGIQQ